VSEVVGKHISLRDDDGTAFRFSEQELLAILNEAGGITHPAAVSFEIHAALLPEDFWDMRSHMSPTLRKALEGEPTSRNYQARSAWALSHTHENTKSVFPQFYCQLQQASGVDMELFRIHPALSHPNGMRQKKRRIPASSAFSGRSLYLKSAFVPA
jgi:hypothetical protein